MTVLNFPASPTTGDTYTENGVLYTWNGSYWDAADSDSFDDRYVEVIGDTMTGQLTLPGGGSAKQALQKQEIESIVSNEISSGTYWDRSGGTLSPEVSSDSVDIGSGKITLNANGLGEFKGGLNTYNGDIYLYRNAAQAQGFKFDVTNNNISSFSDAGNKKDFSIINNTPDKGLILGADVVQANCEIFGINNTDSNTTFTVRELNGVSKNNSILTQWSGEVGTYSQIVGNAVYSGETSFFKTDIISSATSTFNNGSRVIGYQANFDLNQTGLSVNPNAESIGFYGGVNGNSGHTYNFYAGTDAPNFLGGSTYIGGTTSRNTFDLWKSTLTEEQLEELTAGTLVAPANVSLPGDGEYARQWYYDQQDEETQAELDAGTLDYPTHLAAATFTDTFALGDSTKINLLSNGLGEFTGGVKVSGGNDSSVGYGLWQSGKFLAVSAGSRAIASFKGNSEAAGIGFFPEAGKAYGSGNAFGIEIKPSCSATVGSYTGVGVDYSSDITATKEILAFRVNGNSKVFTAPEVTGYLCSNITGSADVTGFKATTDLLCADGAEAHGFESNLTIAAGKNNFNFFAAGTAPNYFRGDIECDGLINGAFSLRMQSDDPAAFTTTLTTDEEGNDVSNSVYNGTTEDLLSIIKDLRARVTALEAAAGPAKTKTKK